MADLQQREHNQLHAVMLRATHGPYFCRLMQARNMKFNMKQALLFIVERKTGFSLLAQTSADHRSAYNVGLLYFDVGIKGIPAHQKEA